MSSTVEDVEGEWRARGGGLCDIHNHLLPGVDDGCRSFLETLDHLRRFRSEGVTHLVFTPHLLAAHLDARGVERELAMHRERFADVLAALGGDPRIPRLFLGQEILAREAADLEHVVWRHDVGFGGGGTLLVELGFGAGFDGDSVVARARAEGRRIVLAHPERYEYGDLDPLATVARWRESGALLQINGGSVAGLYSDRVRALAVALLAEGLADMVCSDHHGDHRAHDPALAAVALAAAGYAGQVESLMGEGPRGTLPSAAVVTG